jgi:sugar lactone lactonase YvrE
MERSTILKFFTILISILVSLESTAQGPIVRISGDTICTGESISIPIEINSANGVAGISLNLRLPQRGLRYLDFTQSDSRLASVQVNFDTTTRIWSFLWFNFNTFSFNGEIGTINVLATDSFELDSLVWLTTNPGSQLTGAFFQPIQGVQFQNAFWRINQSSPQQNIVAEICTGQSFDLGGVSYTETGQYLAHLTNTAGCDSVVELTLTVRAPDTTILGTHSQETIYQNDFEAHSSGWNTTARFGWNGTTLLGPFSNADLIYTNNNLNPHDSIIVEFDFYIHDSWDNHEPFQISLDGQVLGTYYFYYNQVASYSPFQFLQNLGARCHNSFSSRKYRVRYILAHTSSQIQFRINVWNAQDACDESWSIDNFVLRSVGQRLMICEGTSIQVGNQNIGQPGFYSIALQTSSGCDSLVVFNLALKERSDTTYRAKVLCYGESLLINGQAVQSAGVYYYQFLNAVGCDSIVQWTIDTMPRVVSIGSPLVCAGDELIIDTHVPDWSRVEWVKDQVVVESVNRTYTDTAQWSKPSSHPAGLFFHEATQSLYLVETGNHRVVRWGPGASTPQVVAGGNGAGSGLHQLYNPYDVFVDNNLNVYVSDHTNHRIQKWAYGATSGVTVAGGNGQGSQAYQLNGPYGIWVDPQNRIYIADHNNNRIIRWNQNSNTGAIYRNADRPTDVYFDYLNNFYCSQYNHHNVLRWSPGSIQPLVVAQARHPFQIYVDKSLNIFVSQHQDHKVSRHNQDNIVGENLNLQINCHPFGVYVNDSGSLFVSSHHCDHTIRKFNYLAGQALRDTLPNPSNGTYFARAYRPNGCTLISNSSIVSGPEFEIKGPHQKELCTGDTLRIEATQTSAHWTYQWKKNGDLIAGATASFIDVADQGDYTLAVTDTVGCNRESQVWRIQKIPTLTIQATCPSNELTLTANQNNISSIEWFQDNQLVQSDSLVFQHQQTNAWSLNAPRGMFVDARGFTYIADSENDRVIRWQQGASQGVVVAGGNGRGSALNQFDRPSSVFVDAKGVVYVTDQFNHRVMAWLPGAYSGVVVAGGNGAGSGLHQLNQPYGIWVNGLNQIYVSDYGNARIMSWEVGAYQGVRIAGNSSAGNGGDQLNGPMGIYLSEDKYLYIADMLNNRVQRWAPGANYGVTVAGGNGIGSAMNQLNQPVDVALDSYGALYVSDRDNNRVMQIRPGIIAGVPVVGSGHSNSPHGIFVLPDGRLQVLSRGWGDVRVYQRENLSYKIFRPRFSGNYTARAVSFGGCSVVADGYAGIPSVSINYSKHAEACLGDTVLLRAQLLSGALYQWQKNGVDIPGATDTFVSVFEEGTYRLKLLLGVGCVYTPEFSIRALPSVTLNANSVAACTPGTLSITGSNANISRVDWYRDGVFQHKWNAQYTYATALFGGLNQPHGIHFDFSGMIYVADHENDRILKRDPVTNQEWVVAGGNGRGSALNQMYRPVSVFVDQMGWIYVSDMVNHRVVKWIPGVSQGIVVAGGNGQGSALNQLNHPHGLWVKGSDSLFVVDHSNHRVMLWVRGASQGMVVAGTGTVGGAQNQLNHPTGLFIDHSGSMYVADYHNARIQKFETMANAATTVAGGNGGGSGLHQLNGPWDMAVDGSGSVYVSDINNGRIVRWNKGANQGEVVIGIHNPRGIRVLADGQVWSAEASYGRLTRSTPENLSGKPYSSTTAGSYTAKAYTYGGCEISLSTHAGFVPSVPVFFSHNGESCVGDTGTLRVSFQPGIAYQWQEGGQDIPGATDSVLRISSEGVYRLRATDANGCIHYSNEFIQRAMPSAAVITQLNCMNDTVGAQIAITSNSANLSGIEWYRNNQFHGRQEVHYSNPTAELGGLNWPLGIHVGQDGATYVADHQNDCIVRWNQGASQGVVVAGGNGRGAGLHQLNLPINVFVDNLGWIYVSDRDNHRIVRWIPGQTQGTVVAGGRGQGGGLHQLSSPHGLWVNPRGEMYISDLGNHRIVKWLPGADSGMVVAGGMGSGNGAHQLSHPTGLHISLDDYIYVSDYSNHRIQRWREGATTGVTVAGGNGQGGGLNQLNQPFDISVSGSGSIYISDLSNHRVMVWRPNASDGSIVAGMNGHGNGTGQLNHPYGIRVDRNGRMYLAEGGRGRIAYFEADQLISKTYRTSDVGVYTARIWTYGGCEVNADSCALVVKVVSNTGFLLCEGQTSVLTASFIDGATYQWYKNGVALAGANQHELAVSEPGEFWVLVTRTNGCSNRSCSRFVSRAPAVSIAHSGNLCGSGAVGFGVSSLLDSSVVAVNWFNNGAVVHQSSITYDPIGEIVPGADQYPNHLTLGRNGKDLYVSQHNQHRVWKRNLETGAISNVAGMGGGGGGMNQLNTPYGIFINKDDALYVADHVNHRIVRYLSGAATGTLVAGGNGAGSSASQLNGPYDVWVDPSYNTYIVDHHNHRVQKWAPGASSGITVAGGNGAGGGLNQLYYPTHISMDSDGWLYIADNHNHRIMKWWPGASTGTVVAGGNGYGSGLHQLAHPHGVKVDASGAVYVTDNHNHRVVRWRPGATIGEVVLGGLGSGNSSVQLTHPQGIDVDPTGLLYVADNHNHRIMSYQFFQLDTSTYATAVPGTYKARVYYRNGCYAESNAVRYGRDTVAYGIEPFTSVNNFSNHTQGWNLSQRHNFSGNQLLGPFNNHFLAFTQANLLAHDSIEIEFDWYLHDTWDNNEPFNLSINGQTFASYTFYMHSVASYPNLMYNGTLGGRCASGTTRWYTFKAKVPHSSGNLFFALNQWNAEDLCNESWSIDNFKITCGKQTSICQGDTMQIGQYALTSSGQYHLSFVNQLGCDSVIQAYVQVKPRPNAINLNAQICANTTYLFGNQNLNQSGTYTRTIPSFNGCDSVINLQLLVNPIFSLETTLRLCHGESYQFNGTSLNQSGTYTAALVSQSGCDSLVTLNLLVGDSVIPTYLNQTICQGDTLNIQGEQFWQTGTYTAVLNNQFGCDSLLYLNLQVANPSFTVLYDTIGFGSNYILGNGVLNTTGVYSFLLTNVSGCDSFVTLNLFVSNSPLKGVLRYQNTSLTPMAQVLLTLSSGNQPIDSVTTDGQGFFNLGIRPAGSYQLSFTNPRPWGGVNATDALGISRHFTNLQSLLGLRRQVADVNGTASINSSDALLVSRRYSLIINDFSAGDFGYSMDTFSMGQGDSVYLDVRSLCYGDVNGSYNPSVTSRVSWTRMEQDGDQETNLGAYFLDLKAKHGMDLGAVSLNLRLPEGVQVVSVRSMSKVSDEPVVYNQIGRNLRLAWYHLMPWRLMEGDDVIRLELKGRAEGWLELDEIESELANSDGVALSGLPLTAARLRLQSSKTPLVASIFPNPASNRSSLNLILGQPSTLRVEVVDAIGRRVYQIHDPIRTAGEHRLELPMDEWSDGQYYVLVQALSGDGQVLKQSLKLQKKR